ncbi:HtaA domain-containing protein [Nocardioides sp.]|uniref:HtaA domain-containing protein n=1 Tax=Nocardioides sp. TaxID=35761 RepID=UPI003D1141F1
MGHSPVGLSWGIKASFLDYIERLPDGRVSLTDGAAAAESGWVFPPDPRVGAPDGIDADGFLAFRGGIRFAGHHGMLVVDIVDPWISVRGNEATLTIAGAGARLPLVTCTLAQTPAPAGMAAWAATDVRLTPEAAVIFGVYPPGEPFEPLLIALPLAPA